MKIIPNRAMRLGGMHLERGKVVDVSEIDGELALRQGWAVKPSPIKPAQPAAKAE